MTLRSAWAPRVFAAVCLFVPVGGCGDDNTTDVGTGTTEQQTSAPRLECPDGERFEAVGNAIGQAPITYPTVEEAVQAAVDGDQDEVESAVEIGEESEGVRYAMHDGAGVVVQEALFNEVDGAWQLVRYETC